jgi:hypothetical protein
LVKQPLDNSEEKWKDASFDVKTQVSLTFQCPSGFKALKHFEDSEFKGVELVEDNREILSDGFDMI